MADVVGVALVEAGRLLAARRTRPPALAGRWELPGGKVLPGESARAAAVREIREELGCEVEAVAELARDELLQPGTRLRVVQARLVAGEPLPGEHDAIRWLSADELDEVDWLDADRRFLPDLVELLRQLHSSRARRR